MKLDLDNFSNQNTESLDLYKLTPSEEHDVTTALAAKILNQVLLYRRSSHIHKACGIDCSECRSPHLPIIISAIHSNEPICFVLPAFPGKSPNLTKVLGTLPDMAEQLALRFLETLCEQIREIYSPGAHIILCSDGRVFSDVIGMRESDVTAYQLEIDTLIVELGLKNISTFNLDELGQEIDFVQLRADLMTNYGSPREILREKILRGSTVGAEPEDRAATIMYRGITRFLVEDSTFPGQIKTRTAIQNESKLKSYEVIRRSNAWSELIASRFPEAVRLSIHPQECGSKKLGIRLVGTETWMTPWHGVALKTNGHFKLVKRTEAEALGATIVRSAQGRASHYEMQGI